MPCTDLRLLNVRFRWARLFVYGHNERKAEARIKVKLPNLTQAEPKGLRTFASNLWICLLKGMVRDAV